ncbi:MAG TPA: hypothetical protein VLQ80_17420 [Candidatus Saccharimonadia bacterium]|nr:hypothetical protein [Candidatus Saccharimonadia bacterium]
MIQHISAVTFAVRAMPEALTFYTTLGFPLIVGGPQSPFSTLQAGEAFVNPMVTPTYPRPGGAEPFSGWRMWIRCIRRCVRNRQVQICNMTTVRFSVF